MQAKRQEGDGEMMYNHCPLRTSFIGESMGSVPSSVKMPWEVARHGRMGWMQSGEAAGSVVVVCKEKQPHVS